MPHFEVRSKSDKGWDGCILSGLTDSKLWELWLCMTTEPAQGNLDFVKALKAEIDRRHL